MKWLTVAQENQIKYPVIELLLGMREMFFKQGYSTQFIANQIRKVLKEEGLI
jgi:hypothetical protein